MGVSIEFVQSYSVQRCDLMEGVQYEKQVLLDILLCLLIINIYISFEYITTSSILIDIDLPKDFKLFTSRISYT